MAEKYSYVSFFILLYYVEKQKEKKRNIYMYIVTLYIMFVGKYFDLVRGMVFKRGGLSCMIKKRDTFKNNFGGYYI